MKYHHRTRFLLPLLSLALAVRLAADTPTDSPPPASAKTELASLAPSFGIAMGLSPDLAKLSAQKLAESVDNSRQAIETKLEALFLRWPSDPDRWQAVVFMNQFTPIF